MAASASPTLRLLGTGQGHRAGVLVIHSWWGLTDSFVVFGEALAEAGFVVGLADLYDGKTATSEAQARALRQARRRQPMYKILGCCLDSLRSDLSGDGRLGVVGFSMGGHWAVWLSQRPAYGLRATVLYYAARGGDFGKSESNYLAHFADHDPWVSRNARRGMERAVVKAGRSYRAYDYPGTGHWFAEQARREAFHAEAAELALARSVKHLRESLIA